MTSILLTVLRVIAGAALAVSVVGIAHLVGWFTVDADNRFWIVLMTVASGAFAGAWSRRSSTASG